MITFRSILLILIPFFSISASFAQKNFILYSGQYYHYGLHGLNGVRQTFTYHHYIVKGFSVEVHLFTGSGRGKTFLKIFKKTIF